MRVVDLVSQETGVDASNIMLLRHSTNSIEKLEAFGLSVAEYTSMQPPNSRWDFWAPGSPQVDIVAVIVRDRVDAVYRVVGIEAEGNLYSLSPSFRPFNESRGRRDHLVRRFKLETIPSKATGLRVTGWEGKEINAVLRSHMPTFGEIEFASNSMSRLPDDEAFRDAEEFVFQQGDRRQIIERQIRERRGQRQFREQLRRRYGDRCLVTGCRTLAVLEAAHIHPYRGEDDNHPENGLLLRSDIHTLFDLDLLGIEPTALVVALHPDLMKHDDYADLAGCDLWCPADRRPSQSALTMRYEQFQARLNHPQ